MNDTRYKYQKLDEFWLKIIAIVSMTFDHLGYFLQAYTTTNELLSTVFRIIGRLAFPLFAFMLAEGLRKTTDVKKYLLRLFWVFLPIFVGEAAMYVLHLTEAVDWAVNPPAQIFTTLVLFALFGYFQRKTTKAKYLCLIPVAYTVFAFVGEMTTYCLSQSNFFRFYPLFAMPQYTIYGLLVFLGFYYAPSFAKRFVKRALQLDEAGFLEYQDTPDFQALKNIIGVVVLTFVTVVFWGLFTFIPALAELDPRFFNMSIQVYALADVLLLMCYDGKRGYDAKWFRWVTYLYYPVHLAIIALVFTLIFH
jgi:hypothetical protein